MLWVFKAKHFYLKQWERTEGVKGSQAKPPTKKYTWRDLYPVDLLHGSIVSAVISIVNVIALRFLDFGEINNTNFYLYRKIRTNSNLYVIIFTITVVFLWFLCIELRKYSCFCLSILPILKNYVANFMISFPGCE